MGFPLICCHDEPHISSVNNIMCSLVASGVAVLNLLSVYLPLQTITTITLQCSMFIYIPYYKMKYNKSSFKEVTYLVLGQYLWFLQRKKSIALAMNANPNVWSPHFFTYATSVQNNRFFVV